MNSENLPTQGSKLHSDIFTEQSMAMVIVYHLNSISKERMPTSYQRISNIWIQEIDFEFMPDQFGLIGLIFGLTSKPNLRIVLYNSCLEIQPQLWLLVAVKNVTFLCMWLIKIPKDTCTCIIPMWKTDTHAFI